MAHSKGSMYKSSDVLFDRYCDLCYETQTKYVEVFCYCPTCIQYLCEDCSRFHRAMALSRNHKTQRGSEMPKSQADKPPRYEYCTNHPTEQKSLFCVDHKQLVCSKCHNESHDACLVQPVIRVAAAIRAPDINNFKEAVSGLRNGVLSTKSELETIISSIEAQRTTMHVDVHRSQETMFQKVHALFKAKMRNIDKLCKNQSSGLTEKQFYLKELEGNLNAALNTIDLLYKGEMNANLFLSFNEMFEQLKQYSADLNEITESIENVRMTFKPSQKFSDFLNTSFPLGTVEIQTLKPEIPLVADIKFPLLFQNISNLSSDTIVTTSDSPAKDLTSYQDGKTSDSGIRPTAFLDLTHRKECSHPLGATGQDGTISDSDDPRKEINSCATLATNNKHIVDVHSEHMETHSVKLENDEYFCDISGIAIIQNGRLLLTDKNNCNVKMFSPDMKVISSLSLSEEPTAIALISDKEAAVSRDDNLIDFIQIRTKLLVFGEVLRLRYPISGMASCRDKLCIASTERNSRTLRLIDKTGSILWQIRTGDDGHELFRSLHFVTTFTHNTAVKIILTDKVNNSFTILDSETGKVLVCREMKGKGPDGVTADEFGNIYFCCCSTREVVAMSVDLSEFKTLLTSEHELHEWPCAIAYDCKAQQLFISNNYPSTQNDIQCCKLSY